MSRKGSTRKWGVGSSSWNPPSPTLTREIVEPPNTSESDQQSKKITLKSSGWGNGLTEREVYVPDSSFLRKRYNFGSHHTVRIEEPLPFGSKKAKVSREYLVTPGYETILEKKPGHHADESCLDKNALKRDLAHILITMEEMMKKIDSLQTQIDEITEYLI